MAKTRRKKPAAKGKSSGKFSAKQLFLRILKIIGIAVMVFIVASFLTVLVYKWVNPPITPLMLIRNVEQLTENKKFKREYQFVSYSQISPWMPAAVITSEDQNFMIHHGFDWDAMRQAWHANQSGKSKYMRGGSTISQQTAKNVFLWPGRSYIRKGLEVWFTILIEALWGKKRIMEVYLNVIEMGDGVYGVGAAADKYYKTSPIKLNKWQAAGIASVLPNPRKWSPVYPTPVIVKKQAFILSQIHYFYGQPAK